MQGTGRGVVASSLGFIEPEDFSTSDSDEGEVIGSRERGLDFWKIERECIYDIQKGIL